MEAEKNPVVEKRQHERKPLQLETIYTWNGIECPCSVVDISLKGIGLRVKGTLVVGDEITVKLDRHTLHVTVVRVDGNIVGGTLAQLNEEQLNSILGIKSF